MWAASWLKLMLVTPYKSASRHLSVVIITPPAQMHPMDWFIIAMITASFSYIHSPPSHILDSSVRVSRQLKSMSFSSDSLPMSHVAEPSQTGSESVSTPVALVRRRWTDEYMRIWKMQSSQLNKTFLKWSKWHSKMDKRADSRCW